MPASHPPVGPAPPGASRNPWRPRSLYDLGLAWFEFMDPTTPEKALGPCYSNCQGQWVISTSKNPEGGETPEQREAHAACITPCDEASIAYYKSRGALVALGAVGLLAGVGGAIWLATRKK